MNDLARQKFEALLADLPRAIDRERIAEEFGRTPTDPSLHTDPRAHAAAVVGALLAHRAELREVLQFLAAEHPRLRERTDGVALLFLPLAGEDEEDEPTEMIDPALLATLRGSAGIPRGNRTNLAAAGTPAPPARPEPVSAPQPAAQRPTRQRAQPPSLPRGGGTPPAAPRRRLRPATLAAGVVLLLLAAAALGLAALQ